MALIGKIRDNSWILVTLLALGLGGFIVMDMSSGETSVFGGNANTIADIEGRKVSYQEFNSVERLFNADNSFNQRDFVWNYFVDEALVTQEAEEIGLGVSPKELRELQFGQNLSPIIESRFRDPNTFQVDRNSLNSYRDAIDSDQFTNPEQRVFWAHQEKEITVDRLKRKIGNLVAKAIYAPTWQVEMVSNEENTQVDIAYVQIPFAEIDDASVELSDDDYENYLNENRARFEQDEETRKVEYVVFEVEPTEKDIADIREDLEGLIADFSITDNDTTFLRSNYSNFDPTYYKKEDLPENIADTIFNMEVGAVYGPYEEENTLRAAKVLDRKMIPDSVESRHILLKATDQNAMMQSFRTLDSLKTLIEDGEADFATLAQGISEDGSASKGGDLGYVAPGQMVPQFNNLIFYDAEPNELNIIQTQFGLHLVEVTGRKYINNEEAIQVGYLSEAIVPSTETENQVRREALKFASEYNTRESLLAVVAENDDLEIQTSGPLKVNDYVVGDLGSNQGSRNMVKWAFSSNTDIGDVSAQVYDFQDDVNFFVDKYVVATLKNIQKAGMPSVANVREEIEAAVRNEKKAMIIKEAIGGKDMQAIANQYSTDVDTASNVSFSSNVLPGLGNEPKVISKAFTSEVGTVSEPIVGNNGVYVIKVLNKPQNNTPANIPQLRRTIASNVRIQATNNITQGFRKRADIEDNRAKFY